MKELNIKNDFNYLSMSNYIIIKDKKILFCFSIIYQFYIYINLCKKKYKFIVLYKIIKIWSTLNLRKINIEILNIINKDFLKYLDINKLKNRIIYIPVNLKFIIKIDIIILINRNKKMLENIKNKNKQIINQKRFYSTINIFSYNFNKLKVNLEIFKKIVENDSIKHYLNDILIIFGEEKLYIIFIVILYCYSNNNINIFAIWNIYINYLKIDHDKNKEILKIEIKNLRNFLNYLFDKKLLLLRYTTTINIKNTKKIELNINNNFWNELFKLIFNELNVSNYLTINQNNLSKIKLFHESREKLENKINNICYRINIPYLFFIHSWFILDFNIYINTFHKNLDKEYWDIVKIGEFTLIKDIIEKLIDIHEQNYLNGERIVEIFTKLKICKRGRIYNLSSPFSYISFKFLRPIFEIKENMDIKIIILNKQIKQDYRLELYKNFIKNIRNIKFIEDINFNNIKIRLEILTVKKILSSDKDIKWNIIYIKLNNGIINHIQLDFTCSAYQHFSLNFKNRTIISLVGLNKNIFNVDIYEFLINKVKLRIENYKDKEDNFYKKEKFYELYLKIEKLSLFNRNLFKHSVITYIYGAKFITIIDIIKNYFIKVGYESRKEDRKLLVKCLINEINKLNLNIRIINKSIGTLFFYRQNNTINIIDNFKLNNTYYKLIEYNVSLKINRKWINFKNFYVSNELDKRKIIDTGLVNYIHACDAYLLNKIVIRLNIDVILIHDCISVLPLHIKLVLETSKSIIHEIYDTNFLEKNINSIDFSDLKNKEDLELIKFRKEYLIKQIGKRKIKINDDFIKENYINYKCKF